MKHKFDRKALIPFVVIGDPDYSTSLKVVKGMIRAGASMLELGFPFSDPIADGPTIQAADARALKNGINTDLCFKFIREIRKTSEIPVGLLVYSNLIYQRGAEKFFKDCRESGVDSVLAADLPPEEADDFCKAARKHRIDTVFIVSPLSGQKRLKIILKKCRGFVYLVARLGVTGTREKLNDNTLELIKKVKKNTRLPVFVGFGISKASHVKAVCDAGADGAIVGSAIVKIIEKEQKKRVSEKVSRFVSGLRQEI